MRVPSSCGDRHPITHQGQPVILACTIDHGHTGAHQSYYADRLHGWDRMEPSDRCADIPHWTEH